MGNPITLHIEIQALRSFFERVINSVDDDYAELIARSNRGEFATADDESNAFYLPMMAEEIAIRSILNELNALVEWEIQALAVKPLQDKPIRTISGTNKITLDLNRGQIRTLIEDHYGICFRNLPGFKEVDAIRCNINAWKHRKGFKDPRRPQECPARAIPERYKLERENVYVYLKSTREFLMSLWASLED